jgi:phospholipid transport system substrate-binding protein
MTTALAALFLVLALVAPAAAGAPTDAVKQYTDQVVKILDNPALRSADKRAAVRQVAQQIFDVTETAKRALGPHWQSLDDAQRQEFSQLFSDLLERTYISKIDLYGGERIAYTGESVDGDYAVVRAKITTPRRQTEVPVEARMLKRGDRWSVYDITIENISLVNNYRSQFDAIIRKGSFQELVQRMKAKRDELLNAPSGANRS